MSRQRVEVIGRRFGLLVAREYAEPLTPGVLRVRCDCDCGGQTISRVSNLRGGRAASCGCAGRQKTTARNRTRVTHGQCGSPTYRTWRAMISRCECPGDTSYARYGADGIQVCSEWRASFSAFCRDMGERPLGKTIDRIDNCRGYEPGNCRWATPHEQALNRRPKGWRDHAAAAPSEIDRDLFDEARP